MNAARKFCLVRDRTLGGDPVFQIAVVGKLVDKGGEWDWPRYNVRFTKPRPGYLVPHIEREAYERAIDPREIFDDYRAAVDACDAARRDRFFALGRAGANADVTHPGRKEWESLRASLRADAVAEHAAKVAA